MGRYLDENMGGKEGNVAVGGGVEAVKNVAEAEVGSVEDRGRAKELVEAAVQEESQRRRNHVRINVNEYAGLLGRACPAGVYEYVVDESESGKGRAEGWKGHKLVINSQVCCCSLFSFFVCSLVFLVYHPYSLFALLSELHSLQIM